MFSARVINQRYDGVKLVVLGVNEGGRVMSKWVLFDVDQFNELIDCFGGVAC